MKQLMIVSRSFVNFVAVVWLLLLLCFSNVTANNQFNIGCGVFDAASASAAGMTNDDSLVVGAPGQSLQDCAITIQGFTCFEIVFRGSYVRCNITVSDVVINNDCISRGGVGFEGATLTNIGFILIQRVSRNVATSFAAMPVAPIWHTSSINGINTSYTIRDCQMWYPLSASSQNWRIFFIQFAATVTNVNSFVIQNNFVNFTLQDAGAGTVITDMMEVGLLQADLLFSNIGSFFIQNTTAVFQGVIDCATSRMMLASFHAGFQNVRSLIIDGSRIDWNAQRQRTTSPSCVGQPAEAHVLHVGDVVSNVGTVVVTNSVGNITINAGAGYAIASLVTFNAAVNNMSSFSLLDSNVRIDLNDDSSAGGGSLFAALNTTEQVFEVNNVFVQRVTAWPVVVHSGAGSSAVVFVNTVGANVSGVFDFSDNAFDVTCHAALNIYINAIRVPFGIGNAMRRLVFARNLIAVTSAGSTDSATMAGVKISRFGAQSAIAEERVAAAMDVQNTAAATSFTPTALVLSNTFIDRGGFATTDNTGIVFFSSGVSGHVTEDAADWTIENNTFTVPADRAVSLVLVYGGSAFSPTIVSRFQILQNDINANSHLFEMWQTNQGDSQTVEMLVSEFWTNTTNYASLQQHRIDLGKPTFMIHLVLKTTSNSISESRRTTTLTKTFTLPKTPTQTLTFTKTAIPTPTRTRSRQTRSLSSSLSKQSISNPHSASNTNTKTKLPLPPTVFIKGELFPGVGTVAAVTSILSSPGTYQKTRKAMATAQLLNCPGDEEDIPPLEFDSNPLRIEFGEEVFASYRGAIVGNLICMFAIAIIYAVVCYVYARRKNAKFERIVAFKNKKNNTNKRPKTLSFSESCVELAFPGNMEIPLGVLGPATSAALGPLIFLPHGKTVAIVLLVAGTSFFIVAAFCVYVWMIVRVRSSEILTDAPESESDDDDDEKDKSSFKRQFVKIWHWVFEPIKAWKRTLYVQQYGSLFDAFASPFLLL